MTQIDLGFCYAEEDAGSGFPRITLDPKTSAVEIGRDATFYCRSKGSPTPRTTWFRNSVPIDFDDPRYGLIQECESLP